MTRRVMTIPGRRYTDSPDVDVPEGDRIWALVDARLVDELTMEPVATPVRVTPAGSAFARPSSRRAVRARSAAGGLVGLVGLPTRVMPGLALVNYELGLSIVADGYVPVTRTAFLMPIATFPAAFAPLPLGDIQLHRTGIPIRGRVMRRKPNGDLESLNGAVVRVVNIWPALPTLTVPVPPRPPNVLSLPVPLYSDRVAGTGKVRTCSLTANMAQLKTLVRPAARGDRVLFLSDRVGLAPNDVVGIDRPDGGRVEHAVVAAVDTSVPAAAAGSVSLAYPLALAHGERAEVVPVTVGAPGAPVDFTLDAIAGDTSLILTSMAGLGAPVSVEIFGGTIREYHSAAPPRDDTDPDGFYHLPPIARAAQVRLRVEFGALTPLTAIVALDYPAREQRVDFVFP